MIKRRDFIRVLAAIPAAVLVPFTVANPTAMPTLDDLCPPMPFIGSPYIEFAPLITEEESAFDSAELYLEHGGNVPPCRHEEPVDRVRDLSLDDPQSTVRWVHAEQELWVCHGRDGCMWAPLLHDDCRQRREER